MGTTFKSNIEFSKTNIKSDNIIKICERIQISDKDQKVMFPLTLYYLTIIDEQIKYRKSLQRYSDTQSKSIYHSEH